MEPQSQNINQNLAEVTRNALKNDCQLIIIDEWKQEPGKKCTNIVRGLQYLILCKLFAGPINETSNQGLIDPEVLIAEPERGVQEVHYFEVAANEKRTDDGVLLENGNIYLFFPEAFIVYCKNKCIKNVLFRTIKNPQEFISYHELAKNNNLIDPFFTGVNEYETWKKITLMVNESNLSSHEKMHIIQKYRNIYPPTPKFKSMGDYISFFKTKYVKNTEKIIHFLEIAKNLEQSPI